MTFGKAPHFSLLNPHFKGIQTIARQKGHASLQDTTHVPRNTIAVVVVAFLSKNGKGSGVKGFGYILGDKLQIDLNRGI